MTTELNPNADAPAPKKNGKRKRALLILATVVLVALVAWSASPRRPPAPWSASAPTTV
jgi:membrane fusion protein (multidrug efflux system)